MKTAKMTVPQLALIAGTRAVGGAGAALLLSDKLRDRQRKALGWSLLVVGMVSTIPLVLNVLRKLH